MKYKCTSRTLPLILYLIWIKRIGNQHTFITKCECCLKVGLASGWNHQSCWLLWTIRISDLILRWKNWPWTSSHFNCFISVQIWRPPRGQKILSTCRSNFLQSYKRERESRRASLKLRKDTSFRVKYFLQIYWPLSVRIFSVFLQHYIHTYKY